MAEADPALSAPSPFKSDKGRKRWFPLGETSNVLKMVIGLLIDLLSNFCAAATMILCDAPAATWTGYGRCAFNESAHMCTTVVVYCTVLLSCTLLLYPSAMPSLNCVVVSDSGWLCLYMFCVVHSIYVQLPTTATVVQYE